VLKKAAGNVKTEDEVEDDNNVVQTTSRMRNSGKRTRNDLMKVFQEGSDKDRAAMKDMMEASNEVIKSIADSIKVLVQAQVATLPRQKKNKKTLENIIESSHSSSEEEEPIAQPAPSRGRGRVEPRTSTRERRRGAR
jgi:Mg2+/Co2+ transporter CorC